MKILLLTNYWPPEVGAASHLYYELARALVDRGHQVTVLTGFPRYNIKVVPPQYRGKLQMWEDEHGVRVYRVRTLHLPQNLPAVRGIGHFLLAASFTVGGLRLERPDVLLLYSPPLTMGITASLLSRWKRCPFVLNVQDIFPQSAIDLGLLKQRHMVRFFEWLERRIYQRADRITVHSEGNRANVLAKLGGVDKVQVVHNWIDSEFVRPGPRQNSFREELALDEQFVVSFAGTMGYSQDLDTVLGAAGLLRDHPDILFLMVGDGVETPRLQALSEELALPNVRWVPMQPRDRYPAVLHASDACLVTLHKEVATPVVPSKLLSIMAAARPAVVSVPLDGDAPGIVAEAACGLCVPPGQPRALAEAIRTLYCDRPLATRMGQNGRAFIEQHLTAPAAAAVYEALFADLLKGRKQS